MTDLLRLDRDDEREIVVLFDGTPNCPWGPYISVETEDAYRARQRPLRNARDLTTEELIDVLGRMRFESTAKIAMRFHVHPETVTWISTAAAAGILVLHG